MPQATGHAQSYSIRPTCNSPGQCQINPATFGFNDTNWRQWPLQPRPEQRDADAVGGTVLPTPPAMPEAQLPRAEAVPARPAISGGTGESVLPPTPVLPESGARPGVRPGPAEQTPIPQGVPGIPPGFEITPPLNTAPKADGLLTPSKDPLSGKQPDVLTPITPLTPGAEPAHAPDKGIPTDKFPSLLPDAAPSPSPSQPPPTPNKNKGSSLSRRGADAVATNDPPSASDLEPRMRANWNASLGPEAVGDNRLQNTSFEQQAARVDNTLRTAMKGYCPVELHENNRWAAGNPDIRLTYEGQAYIFSSVAARKRFEAAPEKYAPVQNGNDVVLAMEESRTVPGNVAHSAMWRGRIYLFSSSATLAAFQDDPARYASPSSRHTTLRVPATSL